MGGMRHRSKCRTLSTPIKGAKDPSPKVGKVLSPMRDLDVSGSVSSGGVLNEIILLALTARDLDNRIPPTTFMRYPEVCGRPSVNQPVNVKTRQVWSVIRPQCETYCISRYLTREAGVPFQISHKIDKTYYLYHTLRFA